jgi:hypothetical protein
MKIKQKAKRLLLESLYSIRILMEFLANTPGYIAVQLGCLAISQIVFALKSKW